MLNLCINARDAMPDGGRLTIGTDDVGLSAADLVDRTGPSPGEYVVISVADTGKGMPAGGDGSGVRAVFHDQADWAREPGWG